MELIAPKLGVRVLIWGADVTVNVAPLPATPETVTITLPEVAPDGTGAVMLVAPQLVGVDVLPLNVTVLLP